MLSRRAAFLVALWVIVPLTFSLAPVVIGLPGVVASGMCPAAPPDVVTYPCTVGVYLLRMTAGPWALLGHISLWTMWTFFFSILVGMVWVFRRRAL